MKANLKGYLISAEKIETFTKDNRETRVLTMMVIEPARVNEFGEPVTKDQKHQIKVINKNIDKLPAALVKACTDQRQELEPVAKVNLSLYINSRQFNTKEGVETTASDLIMSDIEILN